MKTAARSTLSSTTSCRICSEHQPCTSATACRLAPYDDVTSDTEVIVHYGSNWRSERSQPANGPKADQPVGARRSRGFVCSNLLNSLFLILALACLPSLVMAAKPNRFTDEEIRELQAAFRTRLNLPEPPLSFKTTPAQIPPYMWDIYRDAQADIVRHFYPIRITSNHRGFLLTYDLKVANNKPSEERVVRAELKLQLAPFSEKGVYVDVYAVDENSNEMREPVDSRFTLPSNRSHWIDLDVLEVFQKSTGDGQLVEMFVEVEPINTAISSRSAALVVYFESDAPGAAEHRKKRSVRHANRHKKKHKLHGNRKLCKREPLSVSFTELNWNYFIVAPPSYEAYQCRGECLYPIPSHSNGTNHAIIQSLVHSIDPSFVPSPCCVPVELEELTILYSDPNGVITMKKYSDMVVKSCGCK